MKKLWKQSISFFSLGLLLPFISSFTPDKDKQLKAGDKAPIFEAFDEDGKLWKSADYEGKKILVVYFYPAAMTGGCTKQACSFRDDKINLEELDVEVIGISGDDPANLKIFRKAHDLNFTLLADPDGKVAKKFGVPIKDGGSIKRVIEGNEMTLTRGVTAARWTFIIDLDGKILHINNQVNAANDSKNVLKVIMEYKAERLD
ncbi:MAG: peroxiredoxin [Bacteroidetes bacterium]|nr:peroxiredoxin [Bacteroidota bacterium]